MADEGFSEAQGGKKTELVERSKRKEKTPQKSKFKETELVLLLVTTMVIWEEDPVLYTAAADW